ncbi:membrane protein [Cyprinid herpesvirus 2]|nr:membrane protein [Cyprinid herpesvirus 2]
MEMSIPKPKLSAMKQFLGDIGRSLLTGDNNIVQVGSGGDGVDPESGSSEVPLKDCCSSKVPLKDCCSSEVPLKDKEKCWLPEPDFYNVEDDKQFLLDDQSPNHHEPEKGPGKLSDDDKRCILKTIGYDDSLVESALRDPRLDSMDVSYNEERRSKDRRYHSLYFMLFDVFMTLLLGTMIVSLRREAAAFTLMVVLLVAFRKFMNHDIWTLRFNVNLMGVFCFSLALFTVGTMLIVAGIRVAVIFTDPGNFRLISETVRIDHVQYVIPMSLGMAGISAIFRGLGSLQGNREYRKDLNVTTCSIFSKFAIYTEREKTVYYGCSKFTMYGLLSVVQLLYMGIFLIGLYWVRIDTHMYSTVIMVVATVFMLMFPLATVFIFPRSHIMRELYVSVSWILSGIITVNALFELYGICKIFTAIKDDSPISMYNMLAERCILIAIMMSACLMLMFTILILGYLVYEYQPKHPDHKPSWVIEGLYHRLKTLNAKD